MGGHEQHGGRVHVKRARVSLCEREARAIDSVAFSKPVPLHCVTRDTRIHGFLFVNNITMCTGMRLGGDVPIIQNEEYTKATSLIKNDY